MNHACRPAETFAPVTHISDGSSQAHALPDCCRLQAAPVCISTVCCNPGCRSRRRAARSAAAASSSSTTWGTTSSTARRARPPPCCAVPRDALLALNFATFLGQDSMQASGQNAGHHHAVTQCDARLLHEGQLTMLKPSFDMAANLLPAHLQKLVGQLGGSIWSVATFEPARVGSSYTHVLAGRFRQQELPARAWPWLRGRSCKTGAWPPLCLTAFHIARAQALRCQRPASAQRAVKPRTGA